MHKYFSYFLSTFFVTKDSLIKWNSSFYFNMALYNMANLCSILLLLCFIHICISFHNNNTVISLFLTVTEYYILKCTGIIWSNFNNLINNDQLLQTVLMKGWISILINRLTYFIICVAIHFILRFVYQGKNVAVPRINLFCPLKRLLPPTPMTEINLWE